MNLHGIVAPYIGAVNPLVPVAVQISTGPTIAADFSQVPTYATPGALQASIAGGVLTVQSISAGALQAGQSLAGAGVLADTEIVAQLTGAEGGPGTYQINRVYDAPVAIEAMATALLMTAQIQPMSWGDLQQLDGLLLNGAKRKIYLYGSVDSVSRVTRRGGDLVTVANGGTDDGVWLVAQVMEQFPDWVSAAMTLQNEG